MVPEQAREGSQAHPPQDDLSREEAAARAALIGDLRYAVSLDLPAEDGEFQSTTTIRFSSRRPGARTFVDLRATRVLAAELNGASWPATLQGGRLPLPPLAAENELRIVARSRYGHSGVGLHHFRDPVDGETYLYSNFEPYDAHRVFPCFDQPDLKGRLELTVVIPAAWVAVANQAVLGEPEPVAGQDRRRWRFRQSPPLSPYLMAVVAGPYHHVHRRHGTVDCGLYCRRSLAPHLDPDEIFEITGQGLDFYERTFGVPYAFGKYDQAFVPELVPGAMENAGCVTLHESFLFQSRVVEPERERRAVVILHEMAHMWFGDLVTMRWWTDLWLNESFASLMELLSLTRATRFQAHRVAFASLVKAAARRQDQFPTTHPITGVVESVVAAQSDFDQITYAKGAAVLRQLLAWVGEEAFFAGLRRYFDAHRFANATLDDFLRAIEEASGRDLRDWARVWLQTASVNTLSVVLQETVSPAGEPAIGRLSIRQTAPEAWPTLRPHRVGIGLYDPTPAGLELRRRVEVDITGAETPVPELAGERRPALILPNDGDLTYAKVRLDPASLATARAQLSRFTDSLPRAILWDTAWDMVRDAQLSASEFVEWACTHADGESELTLAMLVIRQAVQAAELYADPGHTAHLLDRLAARAQQGLADAAPGSDRQLAWARALISAARTPAALATIGGLLHGTTTVAGLTVDTDLRWRIVEALLAQGAAGAELATAETERDRTDEGRRRALTALAGRPDAGAKEEAWTQMTEATDPSVANLRALMAGFLRLDQAPLIEPFVDRYLSQVGLMWEQQPVEVALEFAERLYPRPVVSRRTLERTDARLADGALPAALRRLLLEGRDDVRRALQARQVDAGA